jgi:hypothetical protein
MSDVPDFPRLRLEGKPEMEIMVDQSLKKIIFVTLGEHWNDNS